MLGLSPDNIFFVLLIYGEENIYYWILFSVVLFLWFYKFIKFYEILIYLILFSNSYIG